MAWWEDFAAEQPELAERVKARFTAHRHSTLATLRQDGSPRISGTEVEFTEGGLWLGSMKGAVKALDLRRDPRFALHCLSEDPPEDPRSWPGDAKIAGLAHEVSRPTKPDESHRFRVELTEVVALRISESADHIVIETWHPGRGLERHARY
jgi:hypothetical protein